MGGGEEGTAPGYSMISSVCSSLFSLTLGIPFPFHGAQLRRKGIFTFSVLISTSRVEGFWFSLAELQTRSKSTSCSEPGGPRRPHFVDREGSQTLRQSPPRAVVGPQGRFGVAGDPGAAQCGARLCPAAPLLHPLPSPPLPSAVSPAYLPRDSTNRGLQRDYLPGGGRGTGAASPVGLTATWCTRALRFLTFPIFPAKTHSRPEAAGLKPHTLPEAGPAL